jgi:hypothetical protein
MRSSGSTHVVATFIVMCDAGHMIRKRVVFSSVILYVVLWYSVVTKRMELTNNVVGFVGFKTGFLEKCTKFENRFLQFKKPVWDPRINM